MRDPSDNLANSTVLTDLDDVDMSRAFPGLFASRADGTRGQLIPSLGSNGEVHWRFDEEASPLA